MKEKKRNHTDKGEPNKLSKKKKVLQTEQMRKKEQQIYERKKDIGMTRQEEEWGKDLALIIITHSLNLLHFYDTIKTRLSKIRL